MEVLKFMNMHPLITGGILLFICLIVGIILRFIVLNMISYYAGKSNKVLLNSLRNRFQGAIFLFIPLAIFYFLVGQLRVEPEQLIIIRRIIEIFIIISITVTVIRIINVMEDVLFHKYDISTENNLLARKARTQISFIRKMTIIVVSILGLSTILLSFEDVKNYGATILTSAGVVGIIIGFAAQKTIGNLLAGIQIAFTQPIKIDDVVIVENEWGRIEEIKLTYVVIRIWDNRRLIVPITFFTQTPFQNWTRVSSEILGEVFIYTDYSLPIDELRKETDRVLKTTNLWDEQVNVVQVVDATEKSMKIRILVSSRSSPDSWDLRCLIREKLISFIQEKYPRSLPNFRTTLVEEYSH